MCRQRLGEYRCFVGGKSAYYAPICGPVMNISGVIRLDGLSEIGVRTLRQLAEQHGKNIRLTFGPSQDSAVVSWDSSAALSTIARLIRLFRAIGS